ncbi:MAG: hypothetical protein JW795_20445 [Chitinivibrionales bacterium]|nr:hypothetical protein [Chitinivibrionales bacterium]
MQKYCLILLCSLALLRCDALLKFEEPTKTTMEGVWSAVAAYNQNGSQFLDSISFPVTAFDLNSDNTVVSTAGPMIQYIVYGGNNYVKIASQVDQVFNYASLNFTGGEFFVGDGVVDRFTLEMKLQGAPGQKTLSELLTIIGIDPGFLKEVIYHKFIDVKVSFRGATRDTMVWEWDGTTTARYNIKDDKGDYVLWGGFSPTLFSRCEIVLVRQIKSLVDLVKTP